MKKTRNKVIDMNIKEVLEYALKGIECEIEEKEQQIIKGKHYIEELKKGHEVATKLSIDALKEVINDNKHQIELLKEKQASFKWDLSMIEK